MDHVDIRSDTGTELTKQMRSAILDAYYGDHLYGEDPNVIKLEQMAAQMFGKEAASFVVSGTFGNQVTVMTAGIPGAQIILGDQSHMITYENGSIGRLSRMMIRTVASDQNMFMPVEGVQKAIRRIKDMQAPVQKILAIQNPTSCGRIYPLEQFKRIVQIGKYNRLHVHLDGARVLHACTELGLAPSQIAQDCDSVMFCLSKGLCTPIGSIVVGSKEFIERVNVNRKRMGGILRKPGQIAAMGIIALNSMISCLKEDHKMTQLMSEELRKLNWIQIIQKVETNMIFFKYLDSRVDQNQIHKFLETKGIVTTLMPGGSNMQRFVIHHHIREPEIAKIISALQQYYQQICLKK